MGRKFADNLNEFLSKYALYICLVLVAIILIVALILIFSGKNKKAKNKKIENYDSWIEALGGLDNIKDINAVGSRLSIVLNDKEKVNRDELTALGVSSVLTMSGKLTLVIEDKAEDIASNISTKLSK